MLVLVIYLAPDGNNKDYVRYMHKKATTWAASIWSWCMQQNESWKALNSTIPQTIKYPLSSITLNDKYCKHIMQPIVKFGLTKVGTSSTLHTAIIYGPCSLGSIGIFDPFVIQVTGRIGFLVKHYCNSNLSVPLLRANLSTLQLEAGRRGSIS